MKTELKLAVAAADFFKCQVDNYESMGIEMEFLLSYAYELETLFRVLMQTDGMTDKDIAAILNNIDETILIKYTLEEVFNLQPKTRKKPSKKVAQFFKINESWI